MSGMHLLSVGGAERTPPPPMLSCYGRRMRLGESEVDETGLRARLHILGQEHRDLDAAIDALRGLPGHDQIQLARLKKRKLRLRDEIAIVNDWLIPDIIA